MVARFQRVVLNALVPQLPAAAPFHGPADLVAVGVFHFHVHERMGVAVEELQYIPLDGHSLILEIGGRKRMMRVGFNAQNGHPCEDESE